MRKKERKKERKEERKEERGPKTISGPSEEKMNLSETEERTFTGSDLLLKPGDPTSAFATRSEELTAPHWGQRKLGMVLLDFLIHYWDPKDVPKPVVLYVGAAPGDNIAFVSQLFPEVEWHLYDPREFTIKEGKDVSVFRAEDEISSDKFKKINVYTGDVGFFTDKTAEEWKVINLKSKSVFLVSDIRNVYEDQHDYYMREKTRADDMDAQMKWLQIINPVRAHLKFVLPKPANGDIEVSAPFFRYMPGTVRIQLWLNPFSYETRFVPEDYYEEVDWDVQRYYEQLYDFNANRRRDKYVVVDSNGTEFRGIPKTSLLTDFDSSAEIYLWVRYLEKRGAVPDNKTIKKLASALTASISGKKTLADKRREAKLR